MRGISIAPYESPCQNCKDRHFRCHSKCDRYADFKAKVEAWRTEKNNKWRLTEAHRDAVSRMRRAK